MNENKFILLQNETKAKKLHKMKNIDFCCIGHITRDRIITPQKDIRLSGGTSYYVANALRHLPQDVSFLLVTKLAEKDKEAALQMQRDGIDVRISDSHDTVFFENIYGDNPDDRHQRVLAKSDPFTLSDIDGIQARYYLLGTLLADDFEAGFIKALSERGGRIAIDAQGFLREVRGEKVFPVDWNDKREVLRHASILKVNETEAAIITGQSDPHDAARELASWGVEEVVATLGSHGSLIYAQGEFTEVPAIAPREVVDATGCGDTYMAGYIYQRAKGASIYDAGCFAAAMCTLKLGHSGAFDASISDVEELLKEHGL